MTTKLLVVNQHQFGYHIDYLEYCKYLKKDFETTYLCWDYSWEIVFDKDVNVEYISRAGNLLLRNLQFIKSVLAFLRNQSFQFVIIHYFRGCFIIPLFFKRKHKIHLDIRTGSVSSNLLRRTIYNRFLRFESYFFNSTSVISEGLKKWLRLTRNIYILPLGANPLTIDRQPDHRISLLYVGTLSNRRIEDTVLGLGLFLTKHPSVDIKYTIIGNGWGNEMELIREQIAKFNLERYIEMKGYIPYKDLTQYFEKANVGVTYIPITPGYEYQPTTKTFEYLMAGLPVIATGTYENKKIINEQNGIIISDDPESFSISLEFMYTNIDNYEDNLIRDTVSDYKWERIVEKFKEYIINFMDS